MNDTPETPENEDEMPNGGSGPERPAYDGPTVSISEEMKTSYLAPLFVGKAVVEAKILKFGKTVCFSEARCMDADGKLVATATATAAPKPFKRF